MKKTWWISTHWCTARVVTLDGVIVYAAPVINRFLGQPMAALTTWLQSKQSEKIVVELQQG